MIRVHVADNSVDFFVRNVVPVFILNEQAGQPSHLWQSRSHPDGTTSAHWAEIPTGPELREPELGPSLLIPRGELRALIAALVEYEEKAPPPGDAHALRRDLDREKDRVDLLTEALIGQLPGNHGTRRAV